MRLRRYGSRENLTNRLESSQAQKKLSKTNESGFVVPMNKSRKLSLRSTLVSGMITSKWYSLVSEMRVKNHILDLRFMTIRVFLRYLPNTNQMQ
jgi:hypothetical protein